MASVNIKVERRHEMMAMGDGQRDLEMLQAELELML